MSRCHNFTCGRHGAASEWFDESRHCRDCFAAARVPALAKALGRAVMLPPPVQSPVPQPLPVRCPHLGDPTGETVGCRTCTTSKLKVFTCGKYGLTVLRKTPTSRTIRSCAHCPDNPAKQATTATPPGGTILVPQPPPLALTPTRPRAVVTVAVGPAGKALLAASGPGMARYAEWVGADFVVLDWPGHPDSPMSAKFAVARALDHYERIAGVDADVYLGPRSVNLFDMCAPHEMGVVNELPRHRAARHVGYGLERDYLAFRTAMGFKPLAHVPWYFNAGVMVVPRSHQHLLLPPTRPMPFPNAPVGRSCYEQHYRNAVLLDSGLPYRLMDDRCNWQNWWAAPGFADAPPDAILHWSGAGGQRPTRAEQIRKWAVGRPHPTVSLVIPTIGRPTLARTLASLKGQGWGPGDEVLVVGDGPRPESRQMWEAAGLPGRYLETPTQLGFWGHGVRNWVNETRAAAGECLACLDDDDVWTPGALAAVRTAVAAHPGRPVLFRAEWSGGRLWEDRRLAERNVGTPCVVCPNDPAKLGTWGSRYGGDFDFIKATCDFYPAGPVWREDVLCLIRPENFA